VNNGESPNKDIDKAIKKLMNKIDDQPPEIAVKIINSAVAWEKTKYRIIDAQEVFDPDAL
jgi:hypothetical protein